MTQTQAQKLDAAAQGELRSRLGTVLKAARAKAGVSIEAVAHETKISKQFIIYLESGNFENLPGQVFGRGFIKNISRYLRSDSQELLRLYDECWGEVKKVNIPAATSESPQNTSDLSAVKASAPTKAVIVDDLASVSSMHPRTSDIPDIKHLPSVETSKHRLKLHVPTWLVRKIVSQNTLLTILASIAAVMVLGVFGRWVMSQMNRTNPVTAPTAAVETAPSENAALTNESPELANVTTLSNEAAVPANVIEKVIDPQATQIDGTAARNADASPPIAAAVQSTPDIAKSANPVEASRSISGEESPLKVQGTPIAFEQALEIKVNNPVEIKMIVDGKRTERQMYPVGSTSLTFRDRAELTIQDASQVEVIFNGKSLGTLGNKGRKRKIMFQAKPSESDFQH